MVVLSRIIYIAYIKGDYYQKLYDDLMSNYIETRSAPRGRILDTKGNILVDNKGIREVIYRKLDGINVNDEIRIATALSSILELDDIDVSNKFLKEYYYIKYRDKVDLLISNDMLEKYRDRIITKDEYNNYIYSLITDEMLEKINKKEAYLYRLMNKGYLSEDKVLKSNISDIEYTKINELNLSGIRCDMSYERVYNYDTYFNQVLGYVGSIPEDNKDYYLDKGYSLNDVVGVSFIEEYYEDYLRGKKGLYKVRDDNTLELVSDMVSGNDLVLTIDIELQMKIEELLKREIKNAKKVISSKYYNGSYITISNPNDGSMLAMVGISYNKGSFTSDVVGVFTNSYTVGSVVKGASHTVAYLNGVLDDETKINDGCVKLYSQLPKCSWKNLGSLNDIRALVYSSNYFQFVNAIKVSGKKYRYNMHFNPTLDDFNKYRDVFKLYGLGSYTGIDVRGESPGISGTTLSGDLLLNLSIGQYDTYTPLQLNQYISTIANNGIRFKLRIGDYMIDLDGNKVDVNPSTVLNDVGLDIKYMNRIKEGLEGVVKYGTGVSYIKIVSGAGKTGTSETFYNGKSTITQSFVAYVPSDEPKYAYTIISPHIFYDNNVSNYQYPINSRLSREITNILFEK